jgi:hypothetical protein
MEAAEEVAALAAVFGDDLVVEEAPPPGPAGGSGLSILLRAPADAASPGAGTWALAVTLPAGYPSRPPVATVQPAGPAPVPRAAASSATAALAAAIADRHAAVPGTECVLWVYHTAAELTAAAAAAGAGDAGRPLAPAPSPPRRRRRKRAWVWFHHIKSETKKAAIVSFSVDCGVSGVCKPGFPGVLFVSGPSPAVDECLRRVKGLSWQAVQVRLEEEESDDDDDDDGAGGGGGPGSRPSVLMLGEGDMSALAELQRAAGLDVQFRSAILKLPP